MSDRIPESDLHVPDCGCDGPDVINAERRQSELSACDGCGQTDGRCLPHCTLKRSELSPSKEWTEGFAAGIAEVNAERAELRREAAHAQQDADYYRTAIEKWHDLSCRKNANGPDGPSDEWQRAVNKLVAIATGENYE